MAGNRLASRQNAGQSVGERRYGQVRPRETSNSCLFHFDRKSREVRPTPHTYGRSMLMRTIDIEAAWAAFERRDRSWDGKVIGAVKTTNIYCKPSCPARRPKRENVE